MRKNDNKHSQVTDPNEYYDSPGFPPELQAGATSTPRTGGQSAGPEAGPSPEQEAPWTSGESGPAEPIAPGTSDAPGNAASHDPYKVFEDLIWNAGDEDLDFPEPIPYSLETLAPNLVAGAFPSPANDTRPVPDCHSGVGAPESRQCGNSQCDAEAGTMQAAPGSSPCQGITQPGWIPGPLPRNDITPGPAPPEPPFLVAMRKGKVDEHLNSVDFCGFLEYLGYRRWLGNGATELILPQGCVLQRVDMLRAKEHVESIISGYDFLQAVKDKVFRRLKEFFKAKNLTALPLFEGEFLEDGKDCCYKPYLNCVVEVTSKGCQRLWYNKLDKYVWRSDIIPRVFVRADDWQRGIYFQFTKNQCTNPLSKGPDGKPLYDPDRHRAYLASIGYNLHGFKTRLQPCLTIYSDATEGDRERNGGSGKSMIIQLLNAMQGPGADAAHRIVTETGENLKRDYNHNFDQVTPHTRVVVIDDLDTRRFPLESVYSWVTIGMSVNKKGQESRFLPFEQAPKCVVTSNNPVSGTRDSDLRRRMDVQLFRHYNASHKPIDDFGRGFFSEGFSQQDWAQFDSFAIACIQISLRHEVATAGLPPYANNEQESSLELEIGDDLVEFLDQLILPAISKFGSAKEDAKGLKTSFEEEYGVKRKESSKRFNARIKRYGELRGLSVDIKASGGLNMAFFAPLK